MNLLTTVVFMFGSWLAIGLLMAWAHHTWARHMARLSHGVADPRTRLLFLVSPYYPDTDLEPAASVWDCRCGGRLHDWAGVTHTPRGCHRMKDTP